MIGSLCTGYGGLDLAVEEVTGLSTAWVCEYDKNPSAILADRFPGIPNLGDLTATDWSAVAPITVLTAGYPCQPFSNAGQRRGTADDRHLWPHIADAVRILRPRLVLLENVAGHLSLGFGDVLGDLARLGYDSQWRVVRASDVGAPHQRKRVFIAAWDTADSYAGWSLGDSGGNGSDEESSRGAGPTTPDFDGDGLRGVRGVDAGKCDLDRRCGPDVAWGDYEPAIRRWEANLGRAAPAPTEPASDGRPRLSPRFVEWMMGLPAGWVTDVDISRNAQLKALGNGVVPQQAAYAYRLLLSAVKATA